MGRGVSRVISSARQLVSEEHQMSRIKAENGSASMTTTTATRTQGLSLMVENMKVERSENLHQVENEW